MDEEDRRRMARFFPDANLAEPISCPKCKWAGKLADLKVQYVMTKRPRFFVCPQSECGEQIISTAPHTW